MTCGKFDARRLRCGEHGKFVFLADAVSLLLFCSYTHFGLRLTLGGEEPANPVEGVVGWSLAPSVLACLL